MSLILNAKSFSVLVLVTIVFVFVRPSQRIGTFARDFKCPSLVILLQNLVKLASSLKNRFILHEVMQIWKKKCSLICRKF